jgi:hypothetical protein
MGARMRRSRIAIATVVLGGATVLVGLWIGMSVSLESVIRVGGPAILVAGLLPVIARPLIAGRLRPIDPAEAGPGVVLATATGVGSVDRSPPSVELQVELLPDRIRITADQGRGAEPELPTIPLHDVTSITWVSSRTPGALQAQVTLKSRYQDPITLQLSGSGRELERLRRALAGLLPPGVMVSELPPRRRFRPSLVPVAVVLLLVLSCGVGASVQRLRPLDEPDAAPGYFELTGVGHRPITVGRPWSTRCLPESVVVSGKVPDTVFSAASRAISEFTEASGVPVKLAAGYTDAGWTPGGVQAVILISVVAKVPAVVTGSPADRLADWKAFQPIDGQVSFDWFEGRLYTDLTGDDPVRIRKAVRLIMARSIGIMYSDRPGSGLRRDLDDSVDDFSPADSRAMHLFSGC